MDHIERADNVAYNSTPSSAKWNAEVDRIYGGINDLADEGVALAARVTTAEADIDAAQSAIATIQGGTANGLVARDVDLAIAPRTIETTDYAAMGSTPHPDPLLVQGMSILGGRPIKRITRVTATGNHYPDNMASEIIVFAPSSGTVIYTLGDPANYPAGYDIMLMLPASSSYGVQVYYGTGPSTFTLSGSATYGQIAWLAVVNGAWVAVVLNHVA